MVQFFTWRHLTLLRQATPGDTSEQADAAALLVVLRSLGDAEVNRLIAQASTLSAILAALTSNRRSAHPADVLAPTAPFVGRELQVLRIQDAAARLRHAGPELVSVVGERSLGKSRLLDHLFTEFQRWPGFVVLHARFPSHAPSGGVSIVLDTIAGHVQSTALKDRDALIAGMQRAVGPMSGVIRRASPELGDLLGHVPMPVELHLEEGFNRQATVVADLVASIGSPERPLVLLLDDLDNGDASVHAVLHHLMAPGIHHHTLVVFTAAGRVPGLGVASQIRLELAPLAAGSLRELVTGAMPGPIEQLDRVVTRLSALSKGDPGTAWRLLQVWVSQGVLSTNEHGNWWLNEPTSSNITAFSGLRDLTQDAQTVAITVGAQQDPVTPAWIVDACQLPASIARSAVLSLLECGLFIQDPGGRIGFPDNYTRDLVMKEATQAEVARAHGAVEGWLTTHGLAASIGLRAWHAEHARPSGTDQALACLHLDAGVHHLAQCDARRSEWHFRRVMERSDQAAMVTRAMEGIGDALVMQERVSDALAIYFRVMDRLKHPVEKLRIVNRAAYALYLRGNTDELLALADRALHSVNESIPRTILSTVLAVGQALAAIAGLRRREPELADHLAMLHTTLIAGTASDHPLVGLSSLFRGMAAARGQTSGAASRARAFFAVFLTAVGFDRWGFRLLRRAEADSRSAGDSINLAVVHHLRGQNELALGQYDQGMESLRTGIAEFRRAGDMSVAVISMTISLIYSIDHEPTDRLLDQLAEVEATAWRQRNRAMLPALHGMRMYVQARAGRLMPDEVEAAAAALKLDPSDVVSAVAGSGFAALALLRMGRGPMAMALAARARAKLDSSMSVPFLEIARVADASATVLCSPHIGTARASSRALNSRAQKVGALRVSAKMVAARLALREQQVQRAFAILVEVVETSPIHRELWNTRDAHRLLAEILAGRNAVAAHAHRAFADALDEKLGCKTAISHTQDAPRTLDPPSLPVAAEVSAWELLDRIAQSIKPAMPPKLSVRVSVATGARTCGDPAILELLVVNLLLVARDATTELGEIGIVGEDVELSPEEASSIPDARPGPWVHVRIASTGTLGANTRGALAECRFLANQCGACLVVDGGPTGRVQLDLYLPSPATTTARSSLAVVIHRDEAMRRSLVEGIQRMGWSVLELPVGEAPPPDAELVFVEAALHPLVGATRSQIVQVVRRGTTAEGRVLKVPYLVSELETFLTTAGLDEGVTTESGSRPE
ncbi:MAG: AAA family ATPase [Myxococcota bacterium]